MLTKSKTRLYLEGRLDWIGDEKQRRVADLLVEEAEVRAALAALPPVGEQVPPAKETEPESKPALRPNGLLFGSTEGPTTMIGQVVQIVRESPEGITMPAVRDALNGRFGRDVDSKKTSWYLSEARRKHLLTRVNDLWLPKGSGR
jgi:hypothetical protein